MKNSLVVNNQVRNEIAFSPVGGPEIAAQYTMRDMKNLP